ncbi:MAG: hypothetical protein KC425_15930 [Anaerolineales bacterium]|nr:hypothetical protein [Anaerolineales bacterium]
MKQLADFFALVGIVAGAIAFVMIALAIRDRLVHGRQRPFSEIRREERKWRREIARGQEIAHRSTEIARARDETRRLLMERAVRRHNKRLFDQDCRAVGWDAEHGRWEWDQ